jgi:hypothetical protein
MSHTPVRRWCDQHQRYECESALRLRSSWCHSFPVKGTVRCRHHTSIKPYADVRELARNQAAIACAEGTLIRPDACELCPSRRGDWPTWAVAAHHEDYARPLDVIWLCGPCHSRVHAVHGGLPAYLVWLRAQLAGAERLHERFYAKQPA